jgi:hypothetical protein
MRELRERETDQSNTGCNLPVVVSEGYEPKGEYITVDGMKTCTPLKFPSPSPPNHPSHYLLIFFPPSKAR